ncbi:ABC transporter substrate-binding protein [bacterium]|nr:ABC transporter substrate-binding protein [bacterium]
MKKTVLGLALSSLLLVSQYASALTVGFSQVGSESGWRTAFSESMIAEAEARGIDLRFSDAQQKQENQIKAIRSFIAQGVDAIVVAPVVETGWRPVFMEARRAGIPVFIVDRNVDLNDDSLYVTRIAADFSNEGRAAANWLMDATDGSCNIIELQGTVGSSAALDRMEGFGEVIANYPNAQIIRTQTANFTRTEGKTVMEAILKAEDPDDICALWAHNDEMALGAIQAMEEAGLNPGDDILVVSVDAVDDIFVALDEGTANVSVELSPHLGEPVFDAVEAYMGGKRDFDKWILMEGRIFTQDNYQDEYRRRMGN